MRDRFRLEYRPALSVEDIGQALVDCSPRIVHFSGHGDRDGTLYVGNEDGSKIPIAPAGMAALLGQHAATVDCVILNACRTMLLAEAMAGHFDHVIAMRDAIGDEAAIAFSIGFYQGLAAGMQVRESFQRGRAFLLARLSDQAGHETPALLSKGSAAGGSAAGAYP
jgi:hypothetical protein